MKTYNDYDIIKNPKGLKNMIEVRLTQEELALNIFDYYINMGKSKISRGDVIAYAIAFAVRAENIDASKIGELKVIEDCNYMASGEGVSSPENVIKISNGAFRSVSGFAEDLNVIWHEFRHIADFGEVRENSGRFLDCVNISESCAPLFASAFCDVEKYGLSPKFKQNCEKQSAEVNFGTFSLLDGVKSGCALMGSRKGQRAIAEISEFLNSLYYTSEAEREARAFEGRVFTEFLQTLINSNITPKQRHKLADLQLNMLNTEACKKLTLDKMCKVYKEGKEKFSDACRAYLNYVFAEDEDGLSRFDKSDIMQQIKYAGMSTLCLFRTFNPLYARKVLNKYDEYDRLLQNLERRCAVGGRLLENQRKKSALGKCGEKTETLYKSMCEKVSIISYSLGLMESLISSTPIKWEPQDKKILSSCFSKEQITFIASNRYAINKELNALIDVNELLSECEERGRADCLESVFV